MIGAANMKKNEDNKQESKKHDERQKSQTAKRESSIALRWRWRRRYRKRSSASKKQESQAIRESERRWQRTITQTESLSLCFLLDPVPLLAFCCHTCSPSPSTHRPVIGSLSKSPSL